MQTLHAVIEKEALHATCLISPKLKYVEEIKRAEAQLSLPGLAWEWTVSARRNGQDTCRRWKRSRRPLAFLKEKIR